MKTITLNLDDSLVARYGNLSPEEKKRVDKLLGNVLKEVFKKNQGDKLSDVMDEISRQAQANGLTIAKLAEIMEWDEQTTINLFGEEAVRNGH